MKKGKQPMPSPRNPFVVIAKFRKAGAHRKTHKALRRQAKVEVRRNDGAAVEKELGRVVRRSVIATCSTSRAPIKAWTF